MSNVEVIDRPATPMEPARENTALTPPEMLARALSAGADITVLERLMNLQERWEAAQARKAFDAALSEAKAEFPTIVKNNAVDYHSGRGRVNYRYEDLGSISRAIDPILAKHGLTYRWQTANDGRMVTITCVIAHKDGHSEATSLSAQVDDSGSKNAIQALGSATTYLQRYTLKAALGLAVSADDDAQSVQRRDESPAAATQADGYITDAQADEIANLLIEVGVDIERFLQYMKVESISDIPASEYKRAITALESKRAKK